jgi:RNA polymerase sigma factor (sigma-70 family)
MPSDETFTEALCALRRVLVEWLRRFGVPDADIEDVAHETLLDLCDRPEQLRALCLDELRGYAYLAAEHAAMDHIRTGRRRLMRERLWLMLQPRDLEPRVADLIVAKAVLHTLPDPLAAVLLLCDVQGFSLSDAATTLCAPLGTVKTWLRKARERSRAAAHGDEALPVARAADRRRVLCHARHRAQSVRLTTAPSR